MVKRSYSELREGDTINRTESSSGDLSHAHRLEIIADMIRTALAKNSRNLKIRNEHFNYILQLLNTKGTLKPWISDVRQELESVYGLSLEHSGSEILLVSSLKPESSEILNKLWDSKFDHDDDEGIQLNANFHMPKLRRVPTIVNTPERFVGGFTMLVVSMIVLSGNKISESELLDNLADFGISNLLNAPIPVFNKPVQGVLVDLTRKDYIKKNGSSGSDKSETMAEYSLGERCKREFKPQSIYDFFTEIYQDVDVRDQISESIKRCFPDFSIPQEDTTLETALSEI